jgi:tetratricopeptide (TPR) repeat protein
VRQRQLAWCIELAAGGTEKYWTRGTPWLDRVEPELANVRAGLDFAQESGDVECEVQLTTLMRHYWRVRGHGIEARRRLEDLYARATAIAPGLRARLEQETAVMRMAVGDFDGARALWRSASAMYAQLGNDVEVGRTYAELAACANASGETVEAIEYGERAAAMLAQEEFIHLIVLGNLAEAYEQTGDLVRARETAHRVLEAQRKNGDRDGVGYMSFTLASVALAEGDLDESHRRLVECLTVAGEVGFVELTAYGLGAAAALAVALGALDDAAFLIGACQDSFERTGVTPHASEASRQARVVASLREELAEPDEAIAAGASAGSDAAVAVALALGSRITA